jgi:CYTH domain-containing protein
MIAESLRRSAAPPMEIERKWLLSALPPRVRGLTPATLHQGYLPGDTLVERIRSVTQRGRTRWIRTVKTGRGIARVEIEEATTASLGTALFALTKGKRVEKRRYAVDDGAVTWEIDDFTDRTLVLAELELQHENDEVSLPVWLAPYVVREVTGESDFTNWKLAR